MAAELAHQGAELTAHDPAVGCVPGSVAIQVVDDPYLVAKDAAALVVLTEWPEFRDLDWPRLAAAVARPVVVDTRNLLDPETLAEAGFTHIGVGTQRTEALMRVLALDLHAQTLARRSRAATSSRASCSTSSPSKA